jgi:hypothetical protein
MTTFCVKQIKHLVKQRIFAGIFVLLCASSPSLLFAAPKVFTAVVDEDVVLERLYEVREISFTILEAESEDDFLESGTIQGEAGLDAITGRMIVEVNQLSMSGMSMTAAGYVEAPDDEKGIPACTLWQTRMFEEDKLCYAGKVPKGSEFKIILSIDDDGTMPVAGGQ